MNNRLDRFRASTTSLMSGGNALNAAKQRAVLTLLPDTCTIRYKTASSVSRYGVEADTTYDYRQYNGVDEIPCRADAVRAFRPDALDVQVTVVDELDLHLPHDLPVAEEDVVFLQNLAYKIRKLDNDSLWEITKVVKIMRVSTELDAP